jgi:hypothetical protein
MKNPSENTIRTLSSSELEAVSGGFIGETVSNNSPPPKSMSEPAYKDNSPSMVDRGCSASESNAAFAFCTRE